jgi:hypothetical protein
MGPMEIRPADLAGKVSTRSLSRAEAVELNKIAAVREAVREAAREAAREVL